MLGLAFLVIVAGIFYQRWEVATLVAQAVATAEAPAGDGDSDGSHIDRQPLVDEEPKRLEETTFTDELETVESGSST